MYTVVVDRLGADPAAQAQAAAGVLGGTAYDYRASMNVPGGGPAVLAVTAEAQHAEAMRAGLARGGFEATVVAAKQERPHLDVRRFEFGEQALRVEPRQGEPVDVPYANIDLLVRVTALTTTSGTQTVKERKFSAARAALSGGLMNTKTTKTTRTTRSTDSDDLLFVYAAAAMPLRMSEQAMQYQGLAAAVQPSRTANFAYTVDTLRTRCPAARFDERLRRRSVQSQILGRTLSADEHLELALALVVGSVRAG